MPPEFRFPSDGTLLWISSRIRPEGIVPGRFGCPARRDGWRRARRPRPSRTSSRPSREDCPERFGGTPAYARVISQHRAVVRPLDEQLLGGVSRPLWVLFGAVAIVLVDRLRQRREPVHGARRGPPARPGRAARDWRGARPAHPAADVGGAGRRGVRGPARRRPRVPHAARVSSRGAGRHPAHRRRAHHRAHLARHAGRGLVRGPGVRCRPRDSRVGAGLHAPARRRPRIDEPAPLGARRAHRRPDRARARAAHRRRACSFAASPSLRRVDPGYDTHDIFTFQIAPEGPRLPDGPAYARFDLAFMDRLRALPGVESVGLVENVPLDEGTASVRVLPEGRSGAAENGPLVQVTFEAGDYFKTMRIAVLAGRPLETNDHLSALPNVVISKSAADLLWPGENAIGRRLQRQGLRPLGDRRRRRRGRHAGQLPAADLRRSCTSRSSGPTPMSWLISSPAYVVTHAARRVHRARHPRDRARDRAGSADVPRLHDGRARPAARWWTSRSRC